MKITFTCKLTMTEELENSEVEEVKPSDEIVKELAKDLKGCLTEKGTVEISDCSVTVE